MIRKDKIKLIAVVFLMIILAVVLYLYFSSGSSSSTAENRDDHKVRISKEKFISDIDSIIYTFGIKKEWVMEISNKDKDAKNKSGHVWIYKDIIIPADLPVIEINHEISNYLRGHNFSEKVSEDPKTKNLMMNIFDISDSARLPAGKINFIYSDTVKRNAGSVCIVLDSIDAYSLSDAEKILSSTLEYSVVLPLRNDKAEYQSKVTDAGKDHVLNFSFGGENDIEADFKEDMKENLWRSKIRAAGMNFPKSSGVVLTGNKVSNEFEDAVTNEFLRNNLLIFKDTIFTVISKRENKAEFLIDDIKAKTKAGKSFLFYKINLTPSEFSEFDSRVYDLKKAGYKFYTFGDLQKKIKSVNK